MKKEICSFRQINAAEAELDRITREKVREWEAKNPRPSYEIEEEWEKKNISPRRRYNKIQEGKLLILRDKAKEIIYKAKMQILTPNELIRQVKNFK